MIAWQCHSLDHVYVDVGHNGGEFWMYAFLQAPTRIYSFFPNWSSSQFHDQHNNSINSIISGVHVCVFYFIYCVKYAYKFFLSFLFIENENCENIYGFIYSFNQKLEVESQWKSWMKDSIDLFNTYKK